MTIHEIRLHPEPCEAIKTGMKTIESRLYDEKRKRIQKGDIIRFIKRPDFLDSVSVKVVELLRYPSFEALMNSHPSTLFGAKTSTEAVAAVRQYYSSAQESIDGVVGIRFSLLNE